MPTGTTKLANMINPEVMADMVSAKLPKLLKFTPLAYVETALEGQPGSVLTVPAFEYAGDATDVAEGEAIPLDQLTTKKTTMTIKKAGKGYEIVELAKTATQHVAEAPTTLETIDKALQIFEDEEDVRYVAVINPKDAISLKANIGKEWVKGSELGAEMVVSGTFGEAGGVQIVRSKKVEQGKGFLVQVSAKQTDPDDEAKYGAFVINLKRNVAIETDRDIIKKTTVITGDEHYGVYLYDQSKVVKFGGTE